LRQEPPPPLDPGACVSGETSLDLSPMASHPVRQAQIAACAKIAAVNGYEGGDWVQMVADLRADGKSMLDIARVFGLPRTSLYSVLYKTCNKEQRELLKQAEEHGAEALVDDALDLADNESPSTNAEASQLRTRVELRKWLAGKRNRKYADAEKSAGVQINVGTLHLTALQTHGHRVDLPPAQTPTALPAPESEIVDAEIVPD
jgi:hypothetical protein